jgi:hypothetical protein
MMEGDPLGSTTASPANPGLALVAGVTERKCKRGPHTSPTPATKRRPLWERENEKKKKKNSSRRAPTHISTHTWLLLVGVLLPPGTYRVARARACVCVVLRHQQRVTYDEKMEGQQQQPQQQPNNRSRAGVGRPQQQQAATPPSTTSVRPCSLGEGAAEALAVRVWVTWRCSVPRSKALLQKPMPI